MPLNPRDYFHHIEHLDMSDERKIEFISSVAIIMQSFVDRAFGDAPEQILLGTNAMRGIIPDHPALDSDKEHTQQFNGAALGEAAKESY